MSLRSKYRVRKEALKDQIDTLVEKFKEETGCEVHLIKIYNDDSDRDREITIKTDIDRG